MSLKDEIDRARKTVHADGYSMGIGELMSMYRDGEMDIHPEFQRVFRWGEKQKSRFIESLLLGIPIPSIFVAQRDDGVWDVVDGLQRLSTIFQVAGILKNEKNETLAPLVLRGTKFLPSLEGKTWENDEHPENSLSAEQRMLIKRAKLDVKIILRESDTSNKFELFQRLNTGGSPLSSQEMRNAMLLMTNAEFFRFIKDLADNAKYRRCISLSDRLVDEQYHLELVVRFLVLRKIDTTNLKGVTDLSDFLDDEIIRIAADSQYDRNVEREAFLFTFDALEQSLGEDSFRRFDVKKGKHLGPFLVSAFEAIALGLGYNHEHWQNGSKMPTIEDLVTKLWSDSEFLAGIGSGVSASSRMPVTISVGREVFKP